MKERIKKIIKAVKFCFIVCYKSNAKLFWCKLIVLAGMTFGPLVSSFYWRDILNNLFGESINIKVVVFCLVAFLLLKLLVFFIEHLNSYANSRYSEELRFFMEKNMISKMTHIDIKNMESAALADRVRYVRENMYVVMNIGWNFFDILTAVINTVISFLALSLVNFWIAIGVVFVLIPDAVLNYLYNKKQIALEKSMLRDNRKMDYYGNVVFDPSWQKELRINNTNAFFLKKYREKWMEIERRALLFKKRKNIALLCSFFVGYSSEIIVILISSKNVLNGFCRVGDFQFNYSMVVNLKSNLTAAFNSINRFATDFSILIDIIDFVDAKPEIENSGNLIPPDIFDIEFNNVSFKYPGSTCNVLTNCSFNIKSGQRIALVGLNGSGKTTIIKLILRLYDPDEGTILFSGVDIRQYNVEQLRKKFGVMLQTNIQYCIPLRESLSFADFKDRFNDKRLDQACKKSGFDAIIKLWESKYDCTFGRNYSDNGKTLSVGQWQLLAYTRQVFADKRNVVLDEPSASLDPIAEKRLFEQTYALGEGKTSIVNTHQIYNAKTSDVIFVLSDGKIVESGCHSHLMDLHGLYYSWFSIQKSNYE